MSVLCSSRRRVGSTLIEMVISVTLLGILASVTTLAVRRLTKPASSNPATIIADTLEHVLETGEPVTLQLTVNGRPVTANVNPDGSVVADTTLAIDRFTGRSSHEP